jgi:guanylate kinase
MTDEHRGTIRRPMSRGDLFILSAPSGAGKTTLIRRMFDLAARADARLERRIGFSISYTTRPPRAGEVDGSDYHFVSRERFEAMVAADGFLEWAEVYGNLYGTSRHAVFGQLAASVDVVLDIDVQGAEQVMSRYPEAVSIFVLPPSYAALRERLVRRGLDDPAVIERRLSVSWSEIQRYERYRYVIVNDDVDRASWALAAIVLEKRQRLERMQEQVQAVLASFRASEPT